ncbi:MAG: hypothetical protein B6I29_03050 [Marinitoga sp. 4572_148]|nr:MAG: hypothetical protein B6I29_03050 [Marinitoga sp. 4572_148]
MKKIILLSFLIIFVFAFSDNDPFSMPEINTNIDMNDIFDSDIFSDEFNKYFEEMNQEWNEHLQYIEKEWQNLYEESQKEWDKYYEEYAKQEANFIKNFESIWGEI